MEKPPIGNQRVAPLISKPMMRVAAINPKAQATHPKPSRRTPLGDRNDVANMIATARPRKTNWRRAK